ncbi:unnamed protein product [Tenebrio molitor]|nr:unnamed protein product [Tenebrio molitor]
MRTWPSEPPDLSLTEKTWDHFGDRIRVHDAPFYTNSFRE